MMNPAFHGYEATCERAQKVSKAEGVVQHVNRSTYDNASYVRSDWYDYTVTCATYNNGRLIAEYPENRVENQ